MHISMTPYCERIAYGRFNQEDDNDEVGDDDDDDDDNVGNGVDDYFGECDDLVDCNVTQVDDMAGSLDSSSSEDSSESSSDGSSLGGSSDGSSLGDDDSSGSSDFHYIEDPFYDSDFENWVKEDGDQDEKIGRVADADGEWETDEEDQAAEEGRYYSARYISQVELLKLCKDSKSPKYMFDAIMTWATRSAGVIGYNFLDSAPSRNKFLSDLKEDFDQTSLAPKLVDVPMLGGGIFQIPVFEFVAMVLDLINNPRIAPHLIVNWDDTRESVPFDRNYYGDVHTGQWHERTRKARCKAVGDLLAGLIFFIDRTHIDEKGRCTLEPIMFTLSIIPLWLRNQHFAWRPLSFIKDTKSKSKARNRNAKKGLNLNNAHRMIYESMKGVVKVQRKGGLPTTLTNPNNGEKVDVRLILLLCYIIGDCEGQDLLCGRYGNHTSRVKRISRQCDCPTDRADDHTYDCVYIKMRDIEALVKAGNEEALQDLSYHMHKNGFRRVDFGCNDRGIQGATPSESMHAHKSGIFLYAINGFFELLTPCQLGYLELVMNEVRRFCQRQSDRNVPSVAGSLHMTNLKKIQADDVCGIMFILVLSLRCHAAFDRDNRHSLYAHPQKNRIYEYRNYFELLLITVNFFEQRQVPRDMVDNGGLKESCRVVVKTTKKTIRREEGLGTRLAKVHQQMHAEDDIKNFGAAQTWTLLGGSLFTRLLAKILAVGHN